MRDENTEIIRERVIELIESEFDSDVAFERALNIPEKTVNNWRRGRSASFMRMLPTLSECFSVNITELLNIPIRKDTSELSDEEMQLLLLYRKSRYMSSKMRDSLRKTLETTITMYIEASKEQRARDRARKLKADK